MNVTELWESLPAYLQKLCRDKEEHRQGIIDEYHLSPIQCQQFYSICGHAYVPESSGIRSCQQIEEQVKKYDQNSDKIISIDCDGTQTEIQLPIKSLACFKKCETYAAQNIKTIALIINKWPEKMLKRIKKEILHDVIKDISDIELQITDIKKSYISKKNTLYLEALNILSEINEKKGDSLTNHIDLLCFKFRKNDIYYNQYKKQALLLKKRIHNAYISLQIGKFDKKKQAFVEKLVYKYYDMQLGRLTEEIIPKDLFNYLHKLERNLKNQRIKMNEMNQMIQNKRTQHCYTTHLTNTRSEQFRSKRHKGKNDRHNKKSNSKNNKNKSDNGNKKTKKNKNKNENKNKRKKSNAVLVTDYFKNKSQQK
eukprot:530449_1